MRHVRFAAPLALSALAACAGHSSRPALDASDISPALAIAPCTGDSTIYTDRDTLDGVRAARAGKVPMPRVSDGEWIAAFVVLPTGWADSSSIAITRNGRPTDHRGLRRSVLRTRFSPALKNGCAVRFRTDLTVVTRTVPLGSVR